MRNDYLIDLAERLICTGTSNVYSEVLRALEPKMEVFEEEKDVTNGLGRDRDLSFLPQISTDDLVLIVKETDELAKALGPVDASAIDLKEPDHPKKRRKKEKDTNDEAMVDGAASSDEDESDSDSDDDDSAVSIDSEEPDSEAEYAEHNLDILSNFPGDPHRATIRNHLLLLARHPHKFLHHFPQTHMIPERWTVNFPSLMNKAAHQTIMQIITSRYGLPARRMAQVLSEQGKVGERELIATCFLGQKPMRSHLAKLHAAGLIHIQEVPRDNSRAPHRTMFLWYIDMEKCKSKLVEETFKIMARCLQRAKLEGAKVKTLLEKANRSDVIGKEEQFLTIQEREALEDWRAMEEKFWGEMARLDEVVAVLRDY